VFGVHVAVAQAVHFHSFPAERRKPFLSHPDRNKPCEAALEKSTRRGRVQSPGGSLRAEPALISHFPPTQNPPLGCHCALVIACPDTLSTSPAPFALSSSFLLLLFSLFGWVSSVHSFDICCCCWAGSSGIREHLLCPTIATNNNRLAVATNNHIHSQKRTFTTVYPVHIQLSHIHSAHSHSFRYSSTYSSLQSPSSTLSLSTEY